MADDTDPLDAIVVELFAVPPAEFTAARTARAAQAGAPLAARIAKIRKPVVSAWVVDLLAREGHLTEAMELGTALRDAQDSLDAVALAGLGRQRRQLVAALAQTGADLAHERGVGVSAAARADVETTLNAALIDRNAAAAVATGRLVAPLAAGAPTVAASVSGSAPVAAAPAPEDDLAERRARKTAAAEAREAERAAERADRDRADADAARSRAHERLDRIRARVAALHDELRSAEDEAQRAESALADLERAAVDAAERARTATARAAAARARLEAD
ncbi:transposase [Microbacterium sp.]|uniref:transposase n=1 Tax=Microbacterium sp. TaxID=51671 RepID=UPI00289B7E22|nr:transposase [Microbacterium sp.]